MPRCPYCGRVFGSSRGVLQHIRRSHAGVLVLDVDRVLRDIERSSRGVLGLLGLGPGRGKKGTAGRRR